MERTRSMSSRRTGLGRKARMLRRPATASSTVIMRGILQSKVADTGAGTMAWSRCGGQLSRPTSRLCGSARRCTRYGGQGCGGTAGQQILGQIDGAASAEARSVAGEPLLRLAAAGGVEVGEKFKLGFRLALRRQGAGETAGVNQVKALTGEARVGGIRQTRPRAMMPAHGLDDFNVAQHRLVE